jgi:tetratricopeptide (TPR) repeat protein
MAPTLGMRLPYPLRATAVGALALLGAELGLRRLGWFDPAVLPDPYHGFPGSAPVYRLETRDGEAVYRLSPNRRGRYREVEFPALKPADELRVFCLGGSSVQSERFVRPDCSFPGFLQLYLRALCTDRAPRVINSGGGGTGSVQNLELAREVLEYSPDVLVLYPEGGEKNLIPPAPGAALAHGDRENPARVAARERLAPLHLYCALREGFRALLPSYEPQWLRSAFSALVQQALAEPFSERTFTRMFELKQDRPPVLMEQVIPQAEVDLANARFLENLRAVAELCAGRGVELVMVLPLHNLDYSFYLRFHVDPREILPGRIEDWEQRYAEGLALKRAGEHARALEVLRSIRELYVDDRDDILGFYVAQCHAALGQEDERLRELAAIYLRHPMLAQIRQVAEERGVLLVDPFPALVEAAGGVPGDEHFIDAYHPAPVTNQVIARCIAEALAARGEPGFRPVDDPRRSKVEEQMKKMIAASKIPTNCAVRRAMTRGDYQEALRIARTVPDEELWTGPVDAFYLGWALTRAGELAEAEALYERMKQAWPADARGLPDMSTDEGLVRHAFQGDVFAIF